LAPCETTHVGGAIRREGIFVTLVSETSPIWVGIDVTGVLHSFSAVGLSPWINHLAGASMSSIEIYEKPSCPYCRRAKTLLRTKGAAFVATDVSFDDTKREEMIRRAGGRHTVPQIFIYGCHIGGCDDLYELDRLGHLDSLLLGKS
jgi:glutaredoxin 3